MSLINEALKKAQRMRTAEAVPPSPGSPASTTPVAARRRPWPAQTFVLLTAGGLLLVAVSVAVTLFLLPGASPSEPAPAAPPPQAVAGPGPAPQVETASTPAVSVRLPTTGPVEPVANAPAASSVSAPVTTATTPTQSPPPATAPGSSAVVSASPAANRSPAPATGVSAPDTPVQPPPAPAPAGPNPLAQSFIENLQVTGIRASTTDPRVSMNNRIYRINDVVNREFGLKIVGIEPTRLTFVDSAGTSYVKTF